MTTYATTIPEATGGTVASGLYRLAWIEASSEEADGRTDSLTAMEIRGSDFVWSGGTEGDRGSFETSGNELTFHYRARCELGRETDSDDRRVSYRYTATGDELRLHETISGGDGWEQVQVFVRMSNPSQACELVSVLPETPGNSAQCNASNCFCSFAQNGTLDEAACPF